MMSAVGICLAVFVIISVESFEAEKGEPNDHSILKTGSHTHTRAVGSLTPAEEKSIADALDEIIKKHLEDPKNKDEKSKCLFDHHEFTDLDKFVKITDEKTRKCFWSGIKAIAGTGYVDNDKDCMRVESTMLAHYLGNKYPKKTPYANYPKAPVKWLECHMSEIWAYNPSPKGPDGKHTLEKPVYEGEWKPDNSPDRKLEQMPFFAALWTYASNAVAKTWGQPHLNLFIGAQGNSRSKNHIVGGVFTDVEYVQLKLAAKGEHGIKDINLFIVNDKVFKDENGTALEMKTGKDKDNVEYHYPITCFQDELVKLKAKLFEDKDNGLKVPANKITCTEVELTPTPAHKPGDPAPKPGTPPPKPYQVHEKHCDYATQKCTDAKTLQKLQEQFP